MQIIMHHTCRLCNSPCCKKGCYSIFLDDSEMAARVHAWRAMLDQKLHVDRCSCVFDFVAKLFQDGDNRCVDTFFSTYIASIPVKKNFRRAQPTLSTARMAR